MALKDVFKKLTEKKDSTDVIIKDNSDIIPFASEAFPVVKIDNNELSAYKQIPLASLASLGSAFSQMSEGARTVVQTVSKTIETKEQLYVGINPKNVQGVLQRGNFGINGNIMQINPQGKNVVAGRMQFREYSNLPMKETTTTTLPLDPTLMIVAVALMTIEKKLDGIQKSVEDVLQFLKQEKQSKQRGNLNMLSEIMEDYKSNCHNENFCISRTNEVLSIKTSAYQDIDFYEKQIAAELDKSKWLHGSKDAQEVLNYVTYQFAEYQLACYLFAFSTFLDILLQKNFDPSLLESASKKMIVMSDRYHTLYSDCHSKVAKYQLTAIESKVVDSISIAAKGIGKALGSIPVIKDGPVDEALIAAGESISKFNKDAINKNLQSLEVFESNRMNPFIENIESVNLLYSTNNSMITDGEHLYFLQN